MAKLAAQMYTVRAFTQTAKDFAESCRKIKQMGYAGVQLSAIGPIDPHEIKRVLDGEELDAATHNSLQRMEEDLESLIEEHKLLNCTSSAIGGFFPNIADWNKQTWDSFIAKFNGIARKMAAAKTGIHPGYHNHFHEFAPIDGITPYQRLINELDPSVWFEIDTFWVAYAGLEPSALIRKLAPRIPCIHFKDLTIARTSEPGKDPIRKMCEIGDGNLNWPGIIDACRYAGVQWYIVERDAGDMEPFASLERSLDNMRNRMGL